jgi:maltooligosyltrehalose trehalohydrolase
MGQEWAATSPFCYFTDHAGDLGASVTAGRRKEVERFRAYREHPELVPDPMFAPDSSPIAWNTEETHVAVHFQRPGALFLFG